MDFYINGFSLNLLCLKIQNKVGTKVNKKLNKKFVPMKPKRNNFDLLTKTFNDHI